VNGPRCPACRFFEPSPTSPRYGFCRRNAPRPEFATVGNYIWPTVEEHDWCGEFRRPEDRPVDELMDLIQMVRGGIGFCGHGSIGVTCYLCMGERIAGSMPR
jgi:hypothetical protein